MNSKSKGIAAILSVLVIIAIVATMSIGKQDLNVKKGTITLGDATRKVKTRKATVGELLEEQKIVVEEEDYINALKHRQLEDEFNIVLRKAVPVEFNFKGRKMNLKTAELTVEDMLKSLSIVYNDDDKITPSLDTKLKKDMKISLLDYEERMKTIEEEINFATTVNTNNNLEKGKTIVKREGVNGLKASTIIEIYKDGKLVDTKTEETKILQEPVNKIVENGTKIAKAKTDSTKSKNVKPKKTEVKKKQM